MKQLNRLTTLIQHYEHLTRSKKVKYVYKQLHPRQYSPEQARCLNR